MKERSKSQKDLIRGERERKIEREIITTLSVMWNIRENEKKEERKHKEKLKKEKNKNDDGIKKRGYGGVCT